jgi:hypothetical protein
MPAISLTDLQEQIAQREQELQALREELQARQSHFTELTRRKKQLQSELRQVEEEIAALAATATTERPAPTVPTVPAPAPSARQPRLVDLIVTTLRESSKPLTARQLSEETQRRGFRPSGKNPIKSVKARLQDLKHKGIVRRASGQPGYVLTPSANGAKKEKSVQKPPAKPIKPGPAAKKSRGKESSSAEAGKSTKPRQQGEQPSLREVLTNVLTNSRKPLSVRELAEQIRATGYHSTSKNFVNVVSVQLSKMPNVERVPDKGYRLKKK